MGKRSWFCVCKRSQVEFSFTVLEMITTFSKGHKLHKAKLWSILFFSGKDIIYKNIYNREKTLRIIIYLL